MQAEVQFVSTSISVFESHMQVLTLLGLTAVKGKLMNASDISFFSPQEYFSHLNLAQLENINDC